MDLIAQYRDGRSSITVANEGPPRQLLFSILCRVVTMPVRESGLGHQLVFTVRPTVRVTGIGFATRITVRDVKTTLVSRPKVSSRVHSQSRGFGLSLGFGLKDSVSILASLPRRLALV